MTFIFGLGNPGSAYENTPHNVGFIILDEWTNNWQKKSNYLLGQSNFNGTTYNLVRPTTFINLSGKAVLSVMSYYKVPISDIIVIVDDIYLPFGEIRVRTKGGSGGHNGLKDIIQHSSNDFIRIRIGVGDKPEGWDLSNWVLRQMSNEERNTIKNLSSSIKENVLSFR